MIPGKSYTPEALLQIAWRRKWLILIPAVVITLASGVVTHYLHNRYQSDTLILVVPQRVAESYVRSTVTTRIEDRLPAITRQVLSRTRLERIIQDLNLYPELRKTEFMGDVVERMRNDDIQISGVRGDAFRVTFNADDPRTAMRVAERLGTLFIDESLREREVLAEDTNQFLESQLQDARQQLVENEKRLVAYRRQHDGELPTQVDTNMQGLHNAEMQLQALTESVNRDRDRHLVLERETADAGVSDVSEAPPQAGSRLTDDASGGPSNATAADQLRAAEANLRALLLRLTPEHPDVLRMKRTIEQLRVRADAEEAARPAAALPSVTPGEVRQRNRLQEAKAELEKLDRQIATKTDEEKQLRAVMAGYQKRIEIAPSRESELTALMRDYDTLQQTYRTLLAKKQDSQIATNLEQRQIGEQFKVLDPPRFPDRPSSPDRPRLYLLGFLSALVTGLACAVAAGYLDRTMRSEEDVRLALQLPVLATVPILGPTPSARRRVLAATTNDAAVVALVATVLSRLVG